jgi:hypothetical protein
MSESSRDKNKTNYAGENNSNTMLDSFLEDLKKYESIYKIKYQSVRDMHPATMEPMSPASFILPQGQDSNMPVNQFSRSKGNNPWSGNIPVLTAGSPFSGILELLLNVLGGEDYFTDFLDGIGLAGERYGEMIGNIVSGNREASDSLAGMFEALAGRGEQASSLNGKIIDTMRGQLFDMAGEYATRLGNLTLLSSKAFAALRSMNPLAATTAGVALMALGQVLGSLAGSVGTGSPRVGGTPSVAGDAGTGNDSVEGARPQTQIVIIDSNGRKTPGGGDLDRALDRAGLDRSLRGQIQELIRSGSLTLTG